MTRTNIQCGTVMFIPDSQELVRLLYIDDEKMYAVLIVLNSDSGLPYWVDYQKLCECCDRGEVILYSTVPVQYTSPSLLSLNQHQYKKMQENWELVGSLVTNIPNCYDSQVRTAYINAIRTKSGFSDSKVRRLLHNYWAQGSDKTALAPRFDKRGKRSKPTTNE